MSKIIKSSFVSMSEIRKEIKTIAPDDPNIIRSVGDYEDEDKEHRETVIEEATNDNEIDGSHSIIIEEAEAAADLILEEARDLAAQIKEEARQEGFDMGYQEGLARYEESLANERQALEREREAMEAYYEGQLGEIEPKVADIIRDLVSKMVGESQYDHDVVLYVVRLALREVKGTGDFVVKVSPEDYDRVLAHKKDLGSEISDKIDIEVVKDVDLSKNQCIIETGQGNIDGSLNVRLSGLTRELKLIADSLRRAEGNAYGN